MQPKTPRFGFTLQSDGVARVLSSTVGLSEAFSPESGDPTPDVIAFDGVWDTGASGSVITPQVVSALNLQPIDEQKVQTANGERLAACRTFAVSPLFSTTALLRVKSYVL